MGFLIFYKIIIVCHLGLKPTSFIKCKLYLYFLLYWPNLQTKTLPLGGWLRWWWSVSILSSAPKWPWAHLFMLLCPLVHLPQSFTGLCSKLPIGLPGVNWLLAFKENGKLTEKPYSGFGQCVFVCIALLQDFLLLQRFIPHHISSGGWWALTEVYQQPQSILALPSSVSSPAVST